MGPLFATLLLMPLAALAQPADWRVGLAMADITPEEPLQMGGYAARDQPFESIADRLFAKALALQDSRGAKALLITADLLGFTSERSAAICERLARTEGISRERILLNASHTHAAPLVAGSLLARLSGEDRTRIERYIETIDSKIVAAARKALAEMRPSNLSWGRGVAKFVMNRREFTPDGVILGTNASGLADRTVPVLRVAGANGDLRAVVFGAASHCTTLTGRNLQISGDYAGIAQDEVQKRLPGVQAMFMTGCAGDANPHPRGTLSLARQHGRELASVVEEVLDGDLEPVRGPLATEFRMVDLPLQRFTRQQIERMREGARSYRRFFTDGALERLRQGRQLLDSYPAPFALWQFGQDLTLLAYSGETVVDYVRLAQERLGPLRLWISGYNNDVYGYLPTDRILREGGYETRGLYTDYGLFTPDVQDVVMDAIVEMARSAGRPVH